MDPLFIPNLVIGQGTGPMRVEQNYKNLKLNGLTASKITGYKADFKNLQFDIDSFSPRLEMKADYEMDGKILLFPIKGKGKCNITLGMF